MKIIDTVSWKQLSDRVVAVDTNTGDYYTFNDVASLIWIAVCDGKSVDDIMSKIMKEYDIDDAAKVRLDIEGQLNQWKEMKLMS